MKGVPGAREASRWRGPACCHRILDRVAGLFTLRARGAWAFTRSQWRQAPGTPPDALPGRASNITKAKSGEISLYVAMITPIAP